MINWPVIIPFLILISVAAVSLYANKKQAEKNRVSDLVIKKMTKGAQSLVKSIERESKILKGVEYEKEVFRSECRGGDSASIAIALNRLSDKIRIGNIGISGSEAGEDCP